MLHNLSPVNFLSHLNSIQHPAIFFLEFLILGMMCSWMEMLCDGNPFYFLILNYHISVSIRKGNIQTIYHLSSRGCISIL